MAEIIENIDISKIRDQELNFLFGAGASAGLFPTLATKMKDNEGNWESIETLAQYFEDSIQDDYKSLLFMYYYKQCIEPVMQFEWNTQEKINDLIKNKTNRIDVINNYKKFLCTLLSILETKSEYDKKINLFTTNYDSCFVEAFEDLDESTKVKLTLNDGSQGFKVKTLEVRNFDSLKIRKSPFDNYQSVIPQFNIIHLHGSAYWRKKNDSIQVQYSNDDRIIDDFPDSEFKQFQEMIEKDDAKRDDIDFDLDVIFSSSFKESSISFWGKYKKLPIVNPTKWKFHETVFEEHYYQMLRYMSYVLERRNSTLITFGFSFADEHIRNLLKRALNNKYFTMYICCFKKENIDNLNKYFGDCNNVKYVVSDNPLDFSEFNREIFTLDDVL
ncbi:MULTISPECIES: SIR2 family protein [unclassified Providencia]|uniref:SIR2 family protein n=1 Tax=unclassified Providencia TaxID=2633465 RepID=UPI0023494693|nr:MULTISPECIES: SIR2 family protein [unclassified Providencia]